MLQQTRAQRALLYGSAFDHTGFSGPVNVNTVDTHLDADINTNIKSNSSDLVFVDVCTIVPSAMPSVCVELGKIRVRAGKDTGAAVSILSHALYLRCLRTQGVGKLTPCSLNLQTAGKQSLKVFGQVTMRFVIEGQPLTHTLVVVSDLAVDMLLGNDFWETHVKTTDHENHTMTLKNGTVIPYSSQGMTLQTVFNVRERTTKKKKKKRKMVGGVRGEKKLLINFFGRKKEVFFK